MTKGELFKIRVGVVVLDESDRLLLVRQNKRPFWVLPGGTLEKGETLSQCAVREIKEETNLDITLGPLLFVSDFFAPDGRQVLDVIFCSTLHSGGNMVMETTENVDEMGFFTRQEVAAMATKPEAVFEKILDAWEKGSWPHGSYLGTYG